MSVEFVNQKPDAGTENSYAMDDNSGSIKNIKLTRTATFVNSGSTIGTAITAENLNKMQSDIKIDCFETPISSTNKGITRMELGGGMKVNSDFLDGTNTFNLVFTSVNTGLAESFTFKIIGSMQSWATYRTSYQQIIFFKQYARVIIQFYYYQRNGGTQKWNNEPFLKITPTSMSAAIASKVKIYPENFSISSYDSGSNTSSDTAGGWYHQNDPVLVPGTEKSYGITGGSTGGTSDLSVCFVNVSFILTFN